VKSMDARVGCGDGKIGSTPLQHGSLNRDSLTSSLLPLHDAIPLLKIMSGTQKLQRWG
jgi:hypothetical protein